MTDWEYREDLKEEIEFLLKQIDHDIQVMKWHPANDYLATAVYIRYMDGSELRVFTPELDDVHTLMRLIFKVITAPKQYQPKHAKEDPDEQRD